MIRKRLWEVWMRADERKQLLCWSYMPPYRSWAALFVSYNRHMGPLEVLFESYIPPYGSSIGPTCVLYTAIWVLFRSHLDPVWILYTPTRSYTIPIFSPVSPVQNHTDPVWNHIGFFSRVMFFWSEITSRRFLKRMLLQHGMYMDLGLAWNRFLNAWDLPVFIYLFIFFLLWPCFTQ